MPSSKRYKEYTHLLGICLLFLVRLEDVKKLFVRVRDIRKFGLYLVQVLERVVELSWWLLLYGILVVIDAEGIRLMRLLESNDITTHTWLLKSFILSKKRL